MGARCCAIRSSGKASWSDASMSDADGAHRRGAAVSASQDDAQAPRDEFFPYLLRDLAIERPNQTWAMDITYIPMARGFVYLAAVVDWASRRVLAHRVSISMDTEFCREALEEALARYGSPEILNTDQGSQFTSADSRRPPSARHPHQHGRLRRLARQRVRRAAVAKREVRGGLSARLRHGERGARRVVFLLRVLQRAPTPFFPGREDAR